MKTSDQINEIAAALAKAQAEIKNAVMNRTNPHFKSKYADLASVRDAVTGPLSANGIAIVQATNEAGDKLVVDTRLIHSSGQWVESSYPIFNDTNKPQAMASSLSYARRYSISSICGIASEDDDGNEANEHGQKSPETRNMTGTQGARKAPARPEFDMLQREMRATKTADALAEWASLRKGDIDRLPAEWIKNLREEYDKHKETLTKGMAA